MNKFLIIMLMLELIKSAYFGYKWVPSSFTEVMCDMIFMLILLIGFIVILVKTEIEKLRKEIKEESEAIRKDIK